MIAARPMRALSVGLQAARRNLGPIVWTYLASLLSAFPLALAAGFIVQRRFGSSLEAARFATGLDPQLMMEMVMAEKASLAVFVPLIAGAMLFWGAMSAFLSGAVLLAVGAEAPPRTGELFSGGGRVFGRLLRLILFGVPFAALVTGLVGAGIFALTDWMAEDWVSEKGVLAVRVGSLLVVGLALAWSNGAYDLMKVEAVAKGEHRARYAFVRGLKRALVHPLELMAVYLPFVVAAIAVTVVSSLLDVRIPRSSWILLVVGLLLQQGTAFFRAAVRVGLFGAEVAYVRRGL